MFSGCLRAEPRSSGSERAYIGYRSTGGATTRSFLKGATAVSRITVVFQVS